MEIFSFFEHLNFTSCLLWICFR